MRAHFEHTPPAENGRYYRSIGGDLTRSAIKTGPSMRLEILERESVEPMLWRWRQPALSLFWWNSGTSRYEINADGDRTIVDDAARGGMSLLPADMSISGEFHSYPVSQYKVALINTDFVEGLSRVILERPLIGFEDHTLQRSILDLADWKDDATFPLMAEGWALQAIARLQRRLDNSAPAAVQDGRLATQTMRRLDDYICEQLSETIGINELADMAGMSVRHFARLFRMTTGQTPARFVHERRLALARRLLEAGNATMTDIAYACGFSHSQHFTNSFRRVMGCSPTEYRRLRRN